MQREIVCGPAPSSPGTLVNRAIMVHERLTRQALMPSPGDVEAVAFERPMLDAADRVRSNRLAR
jgi:hypothetical protein